MQENLCKLLYSILLIAQHHYITVTEFFNESLPTCTEQLLNGCVFDSPGMWPTLSGFHTTFKLDSCGFNHFSLSNNQENERTGCARILCRTQNNNAYVVP